MAYGKVFSDHEVFEKKPWQFTSNSSQQPLQARPSLLHKSLLSHMQSQSSWMQALLVISRRERGRRSNIPAKRSSIFMNLKMIRLRGYLKPMFLNYTLMHQGRSGLEDLRLEQSKEFERVFIVLTILFC